MMRTSKFTALLALAWINGSLLAQDITFTNKTATFTNLDGRVFTNVTLVKANDYGIVWKGDGIGLIPYTKLSPEVLESLGIHQERVEHAKALAKRQAALDAQRRAATAAALQQDTVNKQLDQQARLEARAAEEKDAPRKAALAEITALEAQIKAARDEARHTAAAAHDYNMANMNNPYAGYAYVKETTVVNIEDAEERLRELKADYAAKYGRPQTREPAAR
jgi:hypothetical protein